MVRGGGDISLSPPRGNGSLPIRRRATIDHAPELSWNNSLRVALAVSDVCALAVYLHDAPYQLSIDMPGGMCTHLRPLLLVIVGLLSISPSALM